jgi:hypothetical protein
MLRTFNYTGRKRITGDDYVIALHSAEGGELEANVDIEASTMGLPEHARIYVEAYYQTNWQRLDCGTVGVPTEIKNECLHEFDPGAPVRFRIRIIDESGHTGLVLASADGISPETDDNKKNTEPLLPVHFLNLGSEIWRVRWAGDNAVLEINNGIPGHRHLAQRDPVFHAYVLPAVLREVLTRTIIDHNGVEAEEGTPAQDWIQFGASLSGSYPEPYEPGEEEKIYDWVDQVIEQFTDGFDLKTNLINFMKEQ